MNSPPAMISGARIMTRRLMNTAFCTWVTSLVIRVMSVAAEKRLNTA